MRGTIVNASVDAEQCLSRLGCFKQSLRQVTMPMHGPTHHDFAGENFVKEDMPFERTENEKETPVVQPRVGKAAVWTKRRMLPEELASRLHRVEIKIGHFPTRIQHIPLKLPFNVGNELVRLADVHAAGVWTRVRTRSRMPRKSAAASGETGLSAASNNQASNSGDTTKGLCCWSRTERRRSLTRSLASAQTPERTCSCKKSSTSLARAILTHLVSGNAKAVSNLTSRGVRRHSVGKPLKTQFASRKKSPRHRPRFIL